MVNAEDEPAEVKVATAENPIIHHGSDRAPTK
jgi:hypothetical protein